MPIHLLFQKKFTFIIARHLCKFNGKDLQRPKRPLSCKEAGPNFPSSAKLMTENRNPRDFVIKLKEGMPEQHPRKSCVYHD
jgi:hypothetical protein